MRLFCDFQTLWNAILCSKVVFRPQSKYLAWCLSRVQKVEGNFKDFNVVNIGKTSKDYEEKQICFDHLLPCLLFHVNHFSLCSSGFCQFNWRWRLRLFLLPWSSCRIHQLWKGTRVQPLLFKETFSATEFERQLWPQF